MLRRRASFRRLRVLLKRCSYSFKYARVNFNEQMRTKSGRILTQHKCARHLLAFLLLSTVALQKVLIRLLLDLKISRPAITRNSDVCRNFIRVVDSNSMGYTFHVMDGFYGRLGNRIAAIRNMVADADLKCCGVCLPSDILDGWQPDARDRICLASAGRSCSSWEHKPRLSCRKKNGYEWYMMNKVQHAYLYKRNTGESATPSPCADVLLSEYFQINRTHVLGRKCPSNKFYVLHVRAGDIANGHFDESAGIWIPEIKGARDYGPFPTSYFDAAVLNILHRLQMKATLDRIIYVLCETLHNPTCAHFVKVANYIPQLTVQVGDSLVEDMYTMLCATEIVLSFSSLNNALALSTRLEKVHTFTNEPTDTCDLDTFYYWIKDASERAHYKRELAVWRNSAYQRHLVDKDVHIESCTSHGRR